MDGYSFNRGSTRNKESKDTAILLMIEIEGRVSWLLFDLWCSNVEPQ